MRTYLLLPLAAVLLALAGCAGSGSAEYTFVYLKTGPESGRQSAGEAQEIFKGHMANIHRLADAGKLVVAGPFDHPHDPAWRGIYILDESGVDAARELVATDPGVQAGVFTAEIHRFSGPTKLRQTIALERAEIERAATQPATSNPSGVRAYVMVTASAYGPTARAIRNAGYGRNILWSGTFLGTSHGAVFLLDAENPTAVRAELTKAGASDATVDGWWSSTVLAKLPRA